MGGQVISMFIYEAGNCPFLWQMPFRFHYFVVQVHSICNCHILGGTICGASIILLDVEAQCKVQRSVIVFRAPGQLSSSIRACILYCRGPLFVVALVKELRDPMKRGNE